MPRAALKPLFIVILSGWAATPVAAAPIAGRSIPVSPAWVRTIQGLLPRVQSQASMNRYDTLFRVAVVRLSARIEINEQAALGSMDMIRHLPTEYQMDPGTLAEIRNKDFYLSPSVRRRVGDVLSQLEPTRFAGLALSQARAAGETRSGKEGIPFDGTGPSVKDEVVSVPGADEAGSNKTRRPLQKRKSGSDLK